MLLFFQNLFRFALSYLVYVLLCFSLILVYDASCCVCCFLFFFLFVMSFQPWRSSSEWNFWSLMLMMKDWVIIQVQHWSLESVVCSGLYLFWALFLEIKLPLTLFLSLLWRQTLTPKTWDMLPLLKWSPAWRPINLSDKSCVFVCRFHFAVSRIYKEGGSKFITAEQRFVPERTASFLSFHSS